MNLPISNRKLIVVSIALLLFCSPPPIHAQNLWKEGDVYTKRAIKAVRERDYETAIRHYTAGIKKDPYNGDYYGSRGGLNKTIGNHQAALRDFERALELSPEKAGRYQDVALLREELGDIDGAFDALSAAFDNTNQPYMLTLRAQLHMRQREYEEAMLDLDLAAELPADEMSTEIYSTRAEVLFYSGEYRACLDACNVILEGWFREADGSITKSGFIWRSYLGTFVRMTELKSKSGFPEEAQDNYVTAASQIVNYGWAKQAITGRGENHLYLGKYEFARQNFRKLLEKYPDELRAHYLIASSYYKEERYSEAMQTLSTAVSETRDPLLYGYRGLVYARTGRMQDARRDLDIANAQENKDGEVHFISALGYLATGDTSRAYQSLTKAFSRGYHNPSALKLYEDELSGIASQEPFRELMLAYNYPPPGKKEQIVFRTSDAGTNTPAYSGKEKRLALVIGNGNYIHGGYLGNPENDATDIAAALRQLGFDVIELTDGGQVTMKKGIDEFGARLHNYDVGLFFYAGHGIQVEGHNYLIPVDAEINSETDVEYNCVDAGRILSRMEDAENRVNIIVLDACRNNPFERQWTRSSMGRGLARMDAPTGSIIAYATQPGNTASDGPRRNGLYTEALLEELATPGLIIERMFRQVRTKVMERSGEKQIPWESTSLTGDFFFTGSSDQ